MGDTCHIVLLFRCIYAIYFVVNEVLSLPLLVVELSLLPRPKYGTVYTFPRASKGTPGDAKCVTEILGGGTKIRKLGGNKV